MKKIKIGKKSYNIKYTIRALFIFEQITGKSFKIETLLDNYVFFYSMLLANNKDNVLMWDDFLDALDKDPTLFQKIEAAVEDKQEKDSIFNANEDDTSPTDEKKS